MASASSNSVRHFLLWPVLLVCMPLQCATLERLSLDDMIARSSAVVRAKVGDSYAAFSGRVIYTHYQLQVSETLKGSSQPSVEVVVPGGVANNLRQSFPGAPQLNRGDEYVFFLWTSQAGLNQVIGLTQGLFTVAREGSADPVATRAASRELMLERGTGQPVKDQTLVMRLSELRARVAGALATSGKGGGQ